MKEVAIFIPYLSGYGGTEVVIHNLLREYYRNLNRLNVKITLYSLGGFLTNNYLHFHNVNIINFPNNSFLRKILYVVLLPILIPYLLFKIKPNIAISTTPVMWSLFQICSKLFHMNIPVVAWYHYSYESKPVKEFYLRHSDYFFTISKVGKDTLINNGVSSYKIFTVYNPVIPSKRIIKNSKHHNHLVYIGRLEYKSQKNISELFKALSLLNNYNWELRIYGTGPDLDRLRILSEKLNISKNIKWMGFVKNIWDKITIADALILTSNYEGLPMVLLEAISNGLYVISSDCHDGPSEIINHNNGDLYRLHDLDQLMSLLNSVINGNKLYNKIKMKKSISKFYINNYFNRFICDINKILGMGGK